MAISEDGNAAYREMNAFTTFLILKDPQRNMARDRIAFQQMKARKNKKII